MYHTRGRLKGFGAKSATDGMEWSEKDIVQFVCTSIWVVSCVQSAILYIFTFHRSACYNGNVTGYLQREGKPRFLPHYGEACAHLRPYGCNVLDGGHCEKHNTSASLLDLFLWILHCSFCANGNSCSTFVLQAPQFRKVQTVSVSHLNVTVTENPKRKEGGGCCC